MTRSLQVFMRGLVDYAGLFPPARLDMADAVATFAEHRRGEHSWMLGSFICPVGRLGDLEENRRPLSDLAPIDVSVLGTPLDPDAQPNELARLDAEIVARFESAGWARCRQLEVRWPIGMATIPLLRGYSDALHRHGCRYDRLFFEIARTQSWVDDVKTMTAALSGAGKQFGFKIRTGGLTADLYPTVEEVAVAIAACTEARIPMKATAGLHHPLRHYRPDEGVTQHGFFNVFVASALASDAGLKEDGLHRILDERRLQSFSFGNDDFGWNGVRAGIDALERARALQAFSFGSCSFDEPLEDLDAADLL